ELPRPFQSRPPRQLKVTPAAQLDVGISAIVLLNRLEASVRGLQKGEEGVTAQAPPRYLSKSPGENFSSAVALLQVRLKGQHATAKCLFLRGDLFDDLPAGNDGVVRKVPLFDGDVMSGIQP